MFPSYAFDARDSLMYSYVEQIKRTRFLCSYIGFHASTLIFILSDACRLLDLTGLLGDPVCDDPARSTQRPCRICSDSYYFSRRCKAATRDTWLPVQYIRARAVGARRWWRIRTQTTVGSDYFRHISSSSTEQVDWDGRFKPLKIYTDIHLSREDNVAMLALCFIRRATKEQKIITTTWSKNSN